MQASLPPLPPRPPLQPTSSKRKAPENHEIEDEPSKQTLGSHKSRKPTSPVWDHSNKLLIDGEPKAKCVHCGKVLSANNVNRTSHIKDHLSKRCSKKNLKVDICQKMLNYSRRSDGKCSLDATNFSQEFSRKELANMLIMHDSMSTHWLL
ncbi:Zinc finger BED domain-containing protein RICESLEEPER 4 [Bienertia sinuspersici]